MIQSPDTGTVRRGALYLVKQHRAFTALSQESKYENTLFNRGISYGVIHEVVEPTLWYLDEMKFLTDLEEPTESVNTMIGEDEIQRVACEEITLANFSSSKEFPVAR
ncbi:hypothetical protein J6590_063323 [Homalodisca vitripennis]|nr:hypothetical protein J6590_063323 [Homalodisca vitripennis]